jgi:hypothetical protein
MSVALAFMVAFSMIIASTGQAHAASKWEIYPDSGYIGQKNVAVSVGYYDSDAEEFISAKVTKVKSNNTKYIKVNHVSGGSWYLDLKKTGKCKITVTYKTPKGNKYTKTKTVRIKKYPAPIKSLKINNKTVKVARTSSKDTRYECTKSNYSGTHPKIKMTLKDGWKVDDVRAYRGNTKTGKFKSSKLKNSTITKGKEIEFSKTYNYMNVMVFLFNEKTYESMSYDIYIRR